MDIKEKIEYWLDLAEYDIDVAKSLLNSKKFLYVGFFCHLIIEKTLKAYYWYSLKSDPPFTHNLLLLANKSNLLKEMSEDMILFLNKLMPLNIEGRYPIDKQLLIQQLDETRITEILSTTLNVHKWLKELIKY